MQTRQLYIGGQLRSSGESRRLEGRALSFGVESSILYDDCKWFTETLAPGCITEDTIKRSNIIMDYNHDRNQILGRCNKGVGTLQLDLREDGLYFGVDVPHTGFGDEMLELVRRGDICSCSFAFDVEDEDMVWSRNGETGIAHREITRIANLYDVAIVIDPAYPETMVQARKKEIRGANMDQNFNKDQNMDEKVTLDQIKDIMAKFLEQQTASCEVEPEDRDEDIENSDAEAEAPAEAPAPETREGEPVEDENSDAESSDAEVPAEPETRNAKRIKTDNNIIMKKQMTLVQQIRKAMDSNDHKFTVGLEARSMTVNGVESQKVEGTDPYAVGDTTVQEEYQSLIEPLYDNQVIKGLGIHVYSGAPKGDYNFPVMGKSTVGFASEIAAATATGVTTSNVHLSPRRVTAYIDLSK